MNSPFLVQIKLYDSNLLLTDIATTAPKVSLTLERWYIAPGIKQIQVQEGHLWGSLLVSRINLVTFILVFPISGA